MSLVARTRKVHFVGIGGIGMSGLAEILLRSGHQVSGSDRSESEALQHLRDLGAKIQVGHSTDLLQKFLPDVVVYSTAVTADNAEMVFARQHQIPIIRRAEMLGELMRLRRGIAVAGSHGKTTTTGLLALILQEAGMDPAVVIGGRFDAIGSNATWGKGAWLVAEADESDGSFLRLTPELSVVTNIDREHLNHYGTFENALRAFEEFLDRLPFYGRAVLSSDCPHLRSIAAQLNKPRFWYGAEKEFEPDFWIEFVKEGAAPEFRVHRKSPDGKYSLWIEASLKVPGRHNVQNAVAAAIMALELEVSSEVIVRALGKFSGVRRRFEKRGEWRGHPVIEDYGHHPTEIVATLAACLSVYPQAPWVLFQPHRFSRTRELWSEFSTCFAGAQQVMTLPIYAASEPRELWVEKLDGVEFARNVQQVPARACASPEAVLEFLQDNESEKKIPAGAPLLIMGAGDVSRIIPRILDLK